MWNYSITPKLASTFNNFVWLDIPTSETPWCANVLLINKTFQSIYTISIVFLHPWSIEKVETTKEGEKQTMT